jgi:hypothetical protein
MDANRQVHERIEARLITLRREYDAGQLKILQAERVLTSLRETVLRISGAILALELLSPLASAAALKEQPESNRFGHNCRSQIAPSMQAKHAKSHGFLPAAKRFHRLSC